MNKLLALYFALPHDRTLGILTKAFNRVTAKILKRVLDRTVPTYFLRTQHLHPNGLNTRLRNKKVIVSLTSFPARIEDVWIVIECLFRQTYKADRIILWLSKPQFEDVEIPYKLLKQKKRGLEIRFVEGDLRAHKKYFYAVQEFQQDIMITVDDDVFYHKNVIQALMLGHSKFPDFIVANRAHQITFDSENNKIKPYRKWLHNVKRKEPSFLYVPTGVGGVLYPPHSLSDKLFNEEVIKEICFQADDLWLKAGSLMNYRKVYVTQNYKQEFITVGKTQNNKLVTSNSLNGGNDQQFRAVLDYFQLRNLEKFSV